MCLSLLYFYFVFLCVFLRFNPFIMAAKASEVPVPQAAQKKEEIFGFKTYFRELGYYITRREQYERGITLFIFKIVLIFPNL